MESKKPISHTTAGLILGAVIIVYSIALNFLNLATNQILAWMTYLLLIVGLIIFIHQYGKAMNNYISFGNLFAYGFKTTAIIVLFFIFFLVIFNLIFPEYKEKGFEMARQKMEEQGKLTNTQIEEGIAMVRKFFWIGLIGGTLLVCAIVGAIGSLIGAAITKKKGVNPLDQLDLR